MRFERIGTFQLRKNSHDLFRYLTKLLVCLFLNWKISESHLLFDGRIVGIQQIDVQGQVA